MACGCGTCGPGRRAGKRWRHSEKVMRWRPGRWTAPSGDHRRPLMACGWGPADRGGARRTASATSFIVAVAAGKMDGTPMAVTGDFVAGSGCGTCGPGRRVANRLAAQCGKEISCGGGRGGRRYPYGGHSAAGWRAGVGPAGREGAWRPAWRRRRIFAVAVGRSTVHRWRSRRPSGVRVWDLRTGARVAADVGNARGITAVAVWETWMPPR